MKKNAFARLSCKSILFYINLLHFHLKSAYTIMYIKQVIATLAAEMRPNNGFDTLKR